MHSKLTCSKNFVPTIQVNKVFFNRNIQKIKFFQITSFLFQPDKLIVNKIINIKKHEYENM